MVEEEFVGLAVIGDVQITTEGGRAAHADSLVYVHAQLAVAGLRDVGLSAAPGKVVVGDPTVALVAGFEAGSVPQPPRLTEKRAADRAR